MSDFHLSTLQNVQKLLQDKLNNPLKLNNALRFLAKYRAALVQNTLIQESGLTIKGGLFQGMEFLPISTEGCYIPKLLGCYEEELQPHLQQILQRNYQVIINVGAAEGYYAVGLARLLPDTKIYAFDTNHNSHPICRDLATRNGVADRILVRGEMKWGDFAEFAQQRTLVLCDIEGGEVALLDPQKAPQLYNMDIIVELHDGFVAGATPTILERFGSTHDIQMIYPSVRRTPPEIPVFQHLNHLDQLLAIWEWRSFPTPWAILRSHNLGQQDVFVI